MRKVKHGDVWLFIGPCLICGNDITNEEGKEIDCYNEECREYRRNLVVPEGWTITPFEKGFKYPSEVKELTIEEQLEKFSYRWTDEQLEQLKRHVEGLEVNSNLSHGGRWLFSLLILWLILIAGIGLFYLFRWLV